MRPTVGVVVCAYTMARCAEIDAAIASLLTQQPAAEQVLLVVDHNEQLLVWARGRWPGVEVLASTGPAGLSGARNTGIAACSCEVIAFLDDDAAARPGWLDQLTRAYADPRVAATGGRAVPAWATGSAAPKLAPELWWVVGCTYVGQPLTTADVRNVMGCSMSFRRSALSDLGGGFVDGIGRVGAVPLGCEETELCIRMRQHDNAARIVFEPAAVVDHQVGAERTTWSYLVRRSYAEGLSKAAISRLVGAGDALSAERAYTRSVLPRGVGRALKRGHPSGALAIVASVSCAAAGYLRGRSVRPLGEAVALDPEPMLRQSA